MMFKRLLVPLDETARDEEVLAVARGFAKRSGAAVILMHVQERIPELSAAVGTNQYLEHRVKELRAEGIETRYLVDYGQPPKEIAASANEEQPDLIIVAPHRRAWLEAMRHPSVTASLLSRAGAPMLVWPEHTSARDLLSTLATPGAAVLVPLDGSALAEHALPFAVDLALEYARPLMLLHVVTPVTVLGAGPATTRLGLETQGAELREARTYLGTMRKRLARETGLDVQSMVLRGAPTQELLRIAGSRTGSVMVLSTHGRSGFVRVMVGSVAAELVRESPIPVFVIAPRAWHGDTAVATRTTAHEQPTVGS